MTMDIKQRLEQAVRKQCIVAYDPSDQVKLCQDALAAIEGLENELASSMVAPLAVGVPRDVIADDVLEQIAATLKSMDETLIGIYRGGPFDRS
jgi:hypothetical protein